MFAFRLCWTASRGVGLRVVVSQRVEVLPERNEIRDTLDHRLVNFLVMAGLSPIPVPNVLNKEEADGWCNYDLLNAWLMELNPAAVVLSGGNDIGQCVERDLTEGCLLEFAKLEQLPVFGICRGMQMMAHHAGTGLEEIKGHAGVRHSLYPTSITDKFPSEVNSYHDWKIESCPDGYDVLAVSEGGSIEAIRHKIYRWEGWMWHPERENKFNIQDIKRVKAILAGC